MSKKGKVLIIIVALIIQIVIGATYGFSMISISSWIYFMVWCMCATMICKVAGAMETV